jgi:alkylhydroperoxidase family enzyme
MGPGFPGFPGAGVGSTVRTVTDAPWREHSPAAFDCFDRIEALAAGAVEPALLDPVRVAVASALAHPEELARTPVGGGDIDDPRVAVCVDFTEQFVVDVSGTTDEQRGALGTALGADTFTFVQALYVVDVFQRGRIALERVFGVAYGPMGEPTTGDLWATLEEFMRVVALDTALDPVTTELVRLRGARAHDCRICQSRLSLRAVETAGDDALFAADADDGALTERQQAALALADAVIWQPTAIDDELVARVRRELSDAEIVEIVLDLVRNAANKIAVSLGGDEAVVTDGVEYYDVDATGEVVADVDRDTVRTATA